MAAVNSASPSHLSSAVSAAETRHQLREAVARPPLATGAITDMNPQASPPLRAYPDPISGNAQIADDSAYFTSQRTEQPPLSQEDQTLAHSLAHDINGHMTTLSPQISNGHAQQGFGIDAQGALPQTPHQAPIGTSMAGQHSGADPNQDLSYGIGSDRRKRSKVSRACDECRRKKVRCDSTTSDGNNIETCSNCRRLKLTCQFERAPMKRGPSKGYIKELAERVQQVESQMGIPAGYRPSLDAGSPSDPYPEQYSPTEPMSGGRKRTFSQFDGRNPFTQSPHPNRDRLTSLGGYSSNHGQQGSRGSVALAPDQQFTDISPTAAAPPVELAKPFWAEHTEIAFPTIKPTQEIGAAVDNEWKADSLFNIYVDVLHHDLSVLPRSYETVRYYVNKCPQELASAFTYQLAMACGADFPDSTLASDLDLDDYAWANARILPSNRDFPENVVWLWFYTFLLVDVDADIARLGGMPRQLSKQTVLKMATDLGLFLLTYVGNENLEAIDGSIDAPENVVRRTWDCISIFAQLHAIGTGTEDRTMSMDSKTLSSSVERRNLLSEPTSFLAALSPILSLLSSHISISAVSRPDPVTNSKTRRVIESFVDILVSTLPSTSASSSLVQEARLFVSLLLSRHTFVNDASEILHLTVKLVDRLRTDPVNPQGHEPSIVKPLDLHLYTLAGLTLLEMIDSEDVDLLKASQDSLARLRHALEQISERTHSRARNRRLTSQPSAISPLHWSDALLRVVEARSQADQGQHPSQATTEGTDSGGDVQKEDHSDPVNGSNEAKADIQVLSAHQRYLISRLTDVASIQNTIRASGKTMAVIDFSLLTRSGYLNVLADLNGFRSLTWSN